MSHISGLDSPSPASKEDIRHASADTHIGQMEQQAPHVKAESAAHSLDEKADKPSELDDFEGQQDDAYPQGFRLAIVTLGIMAFILMVALDNYILGLSSYLR